MGTKELGPVLFIEKKILVFRQEIFLDSRETNQSLLYIIVFVIDKTSIYAVFAHHLKGF